MTARLHRRAALLLGVAAWGVASGGALAQGATQILRGSAAQSSPQADAFIAYENALIDGGLDAAAKHAAPAKVQENQEMLKAFGADGFKQMQAAKRAARVAPAERRKQIRKVEVRGDYAYLEADSGQRGVLDVAGFQKTAEGWMVAPVRR